MEHNFLTIRETARAGIMSEHFLRILDKQNRLPCVRVGNRAYVNVPQLIEQLNAESRANAERSTSK